MCDGIINQKVLFISELMRLERPGERQEYLQEHLAWTIEELKAYLTSLAPKQQLRAETTYKNE